MILYNWSRVFKIVLHGTNMCVNSFALTGIPSTVTKMSRSLFKTTGYRIPGWSSPYVVNVWWKCVLIPYARTIHKMETLLRGISSSCDTSKLRRFHACFMWRLKVDNDRREVNVRWNASCARYQCMINVARNLRISALSWCESFFKTKVL